MSGLSSKQSPSLEEGDDEGVSCSARPPVVGQEDVYHQEYEWSNKSEQCPPQSQNPVYDSDSPSVSIDRPQLVGRSLNPNYERLTPEDRPHNVYHRASKPFHDITPPGPYHYNLPSSSYEASQTTKLSPSDFLVPGSVPVQRNLPESSDPHANLRPWLRWALAIHYLLHDANGVGLFRRYLQTEGKQHVDALEFWFAVEGLHGQITPETVAQLVKVIYRRYFTKTQLPVDDQMRRDVANKYKLAAPHMLADLFDVAQNHVETLMRQTTYPNFLKSDIYLDYVQVSRIIHHLL